MKKLFLLATAVVFFTAEVLAIPIFHYSRSKSCGPYGCAETSKSKDEVVNQVGDHGLVIDINCSGWGFNSCPKSIGPMNDPEIDAFDEYVVDDLLTYIDNQKAAGNPSGSHYATYVNTTTGMTYYYLAVWDEVTPVGGGDVQETITIDRLN